MDFLAFSHGQTQSKLWLCEHLEPHLPPAAQVAIIGSWYSILSFMMLTRNERKYSMITNIDQDDSCTDISNKLIDGWAVGNDYRVRNICKNIEKISPIDFAAYNVVINTSCEHMNPKWYTKVTEDQLICLQTSNRVTDDPVWNITNPIPTMEDFKKKYPMSQILFEGEKIFDYGHLVYSRYMLIGRL